MSYPAGRLPMSENVKSFRFDWHPKDAFADFMGMSAEQIGVQMQIINLILIRGERIDNDPKWIGQAIRDMGPAKCRRIISELVSMGAIYIDNDGKIGQKRAEIEFKNTRNRREIRVKSAPNSPEIHAKSARNSAEKKGSFEQNQSDNISLETETETAPDIRGSISKVLEEMPSLKPDLVEAFFQHRKTIGKPVHKNFIPAIIGDLKKLAADGDDPNAVIEQTIKNGWSSLQPLKKEKQNAKRKSQSRKLAEQAGDLLDKYRDPEPHSGDDSLL